jgi:hypothetical protein
MITPKINAMFQFIEFLHSNIENFKQYDGLMESLILLDRELSKIDPEKNFAAKMKCDEVQAEYVGKLEIIEKNIVEPIRNTAFELKISDLGIINNLWNYLISDINNLKENFSKDDLPEIFKYKNKYLEFRTKTKHTYFESFFFGDLNEVLKRLFDYFGETEQNEFEPFETKAIKVNDFGEMFEQLQKGQKSFKLPFDILLSPTKFQQQSNIEPLPPQPIAKQNDKLSDLITHQKSIEIIDAIKVKYKNIKGKRLKLLLLVLQDLCLIPKERIAKKFHECCKAEFAWDIASYPAMNDYNYNEYADNVEYSNMKQYIETLTK